MSMALYQKYRPCGFEGVLGQEHITTTLINQIRLGRIGHAYLFTGSRGVGKTTCARIFARAINCEHPSNGSACGQCPTCLALSDKSNIDITEIDAASNNGVDDAREIRERVKYPPMHGKYKVYIIDEVHMLSGSAFNALLKTLEEPPAHAVFILATTEVHKLPATILSRCMRFDFRLVNLDTLISLICRIYNEEKKEYEMEAVKLIASAADGSVRDALSIADTCLNHSAGKLTYQDTLDCLGASDPAKIRKLFTAIAQSNYGECLTEIDALSGLGKSMSLIAKDLTLYARDLMLGKCAPSLILSSRENVEAIKEESTKYSVEQLAAVMGVFTELDNELRYSVSPRMVLETACMRACKLLTLDLAALEARIAKLERGEISSSVAITQTKPLELSAKQLWGRIVTYCRSNESARIRSLVGAQSDVELSGNVLKVWATADTYLEMSDSDTLEAIYRAIANEGYSLKVKIDKRSQGIELDKEIEQLQKLMGTGVPVNIKNKK